jgi:hypothetical protein
VRSGLYPPLSATVTSPPQGGRLGAAYQRSTLQKCICFWRAASSFRLRFDCKCDVGIELGMISQHASISPLAGGDVTQWQRGVTCRTAKSRRISEAMRPPHAQRHDRGRTETVERTQGASADGAGLPASDAELVAISPTLPARSTSLIVEVDGSQHAENRDVMTWQELPIWNSQGWQVVRFWNDDVLHDIDNVCTHILRLIARPDDDH